ncbi:MAG: hypothetical protein NZO58_07720, partial [Gemmataceae bacterium]|nr:hypothetical protein [Gemmataceae bacterium]
DRRERTDTVRLFTSPRDVRILTRMSQPGHKWRRSRPWLAALLLCAAGCTAHNPAYFPYNFFHFGEIVPTHAKPNSIAYFANFDPKAVRLEVRPLGSNDNNTVNQVRTQHVLLATIYDKDNKPLRNRRVEWIIDGVGNLLEVDESGGFFSGRGYKLSNKHGVSYTATGEHRINRGTPDRTEDDFMVRPGQCWCTITSAIEGDTHITVYAPGIYDWEKNKVYATIRWVDCVWEFPQPAQARAGGEHVFTTKLWKATDKQPLAGYRVRYRILDGPAAVFLPSQTTDYTSVSDLAGNAQVTIKQAVQAQGLNRIGIEIIRPPDPNAPAGSGIVIARGETAIEWLAPDVALTHTGPASALVGQEVTYSTTIQNNGKIETQGVTLTCPIPDGYVYVRSQPPAFNDGRQLIWTFGPTASGQAQTVQATYRTTRPGPVTSSALMTTVEGQRDQKDFVTQVNAALLRLTIDGPPTAVVGQPITVTMTVVNPGTGTLDNVVLTASFDQNLRHESGVNTLNSQLGAIGPQQSKQATLVLVPRAVGRWSVRVIASSASISETAEYSVLVQQPQMNLRIDGPGKKYLGKNADWTIEVENPADVPLANVLVRDRLPPELQFVAAGQQGQFANGEVVWNLGALQPREKRRLQLTTKCANLTKRAVMAVTASADPGITRDEQREIEIFGLPTLELKMVDVGDPAEVGKRILYRITVTNTGTLPANDVDVRVTIPAETKLVGEPRGPVDGRANVAGGVIVFPTARNVPPQQRLEYVVEVEAVRAGDARCLVEVASSVLPGGPVSEQESTRIVDPVQAPPIPPPPPLPE